MSIHTIGDSCASLQLMAAQINFSVPVMVEIE